MADLPPEIISYILTLLPVISLLRCRTVSKSWRSLIDSHRFISVHLENSLHSKSNINLILSHDSDLYQVDFPALDSAVNLNHPLMCYRNSISLLGSCNGLLCICNVADDIAFWNPSLRKHRLLPSLPAARPSDPDAGILGARACVYGFGYEPFGGDYKLVRILFLYYWNDRSFDSQVMVYSLRTNEWKALPSMPYALCSRSMGVFAGNALHWVVTRKLQPDQRDLIVAFDLRLEGFAEVPLPEFGDGFEIELALLGGCLCTIVNYENARKSDVWVMKDYGSKDSWCKVFTLFKSREIRSLKYVRPLGYSKDGSKVLLECERRKLFWYNLKNEQVTCVRIPGVHNLTEGIICMGSLVSPYSLGENWRKQRKLGCQNTTRKTRDDFLSQGFKLTL